MLIYLQNGEKSVYNFTCMLVNSRYVFLLADVLCVCVCFSHVLHVYYCQPLYMCPVMVGLKQICFIKTLMTGANAAKEIFENYSYAVWMGSVLLFHVCFVKLKKLVLIISRISTFTLKNINEDHCSS